MRLAALLWLAACDVKPQPHAEPATIPRDAGRADAASADAAIARRGSTPFEFPVGVGELFPPPAPRDDAVEHMLVRERPRASCVRPATADQLDQQRAITSRLRVLSGATDGISELAFHWGCTSHGETPVIASFRESDERALDELWIVGADAANLTPELVDRAASSVGEWSSRERLELASAGDFDGDGAAESVIVHWHQYGGRVWTKSSVRIAGVAYELPSALVVTGADGARDGIVQAWPFTPPGREIACDSGAEPNVLIDCTEGQWPGAIEQHPPDWRWEQHPPTLLVLRGTRFTAAPARRVAQLVTATAADRSTLP